MFRKKRSSLVAAFISSSDTQSHTGADSASARPPPEALFDPDHARAPLPPPGGLGEEQPTADCLRLLLEAGCDYLLYTYKAAAEE